jgi:hypothetical protein
MTAPYLLHYAIDSHGENVVHTKLPLRSPAAHNNSTTGYASAVVVLLVDTEIMLAATTHMSSICQHEVAIHGGSDNNVIKRHTHSKTITLVLQATAIAHCCCCCTYVLPASAVAAAAAGGPDDVYLLHLSHYLTVI